MENQEGEYADLNTLINMFKDIMNEDVIYAVVEGCGGNLDQSADIMMNMIADSNTQADAKENLNQEQDKIHENQQALDPPLPTTSSNETTSDNQPLSYVSASQNTGAVKKEMPQQSQSNNFNSIVLAGWTDQLRNILRYYNQGARILLIMRGVPGSGKTYLARNIVEMTIGNKTTDYRTHIFSTDHFFYVRGVYRYEKFKLQEAHLWNQNRVKRALRAGLSPVIVDNTNVKIWEMEPYVREGVRNGYIIEVVEPNTPWARKANQLARKNTHDVPISKIKYMLENFENGVTGEYVLKYFGLSYPGDMVPPVLRKVPEIEYSSQVEKFDATDNEGLSSLQNSEVQDKPLVKPATDHDKISETEKNKYMEIQKQLEEMEKVEQEWENGENWDDISQEIVTSQSSNNVTSGPKPPRNDTYGNSIYSQNLIDSVNKCNDWTQISNFMPQWNYGELSQNLPESTLIKCSVGTCMEIGDTDNTRKNFKILSAVSRDINAFYIESSETKNPKKLMLDKSSMTNEQLIIDAYRCKNEEKHFKAFKKLFKHISSAELRDIFDKCCGDVNWAVDIVLDGMENKQFENIDNDEVDSDVEDNGEQCECLAAYNIISSLYIPDTSTAFKAEHTTPTGPLNKTSITIASTNSTPQIRKTKREKATSDSSLNLKRQIEQNVVISDDHYSEHYLKLRKWRRGETDNDIKEKSDSTLMEEQEEVPGPSNDTSINVEKSDDDNSSIEGVETINVGMEFIAQLDNLFGRNGMLYPENLVPKMSVPMSILTELNALWMESVMDQIDEISKHSEEISRQDEEFARELAMKEAELIQTGKKPAVPDFKEIMDMDFALTVHQKEVAQWKDNEPNDLAAKLTREKLYNLFPDISQDILSELLMAHDNNFQSTVEVLLMSTGRVDILQEEYGINKFVMEKELERQERLIEQEKKALAEVEWPLLPRGEPVAMDTVDKYRLEAGRHLAWRNQNYQKAQEYIRRGMPQVATYYSEIAEYHKQRFEQANSMAAVSLMQVHAEKCPNNATIDLHYLRVSEARESLDLFIDTHIQKLRETQQKGGLRFHTLFFITGRGLHSRDGPKVKPAVRRRLKERGIIFKERNPGLLTARVSADDKMSHQVAQPVL